MIENSTSIYLFKVNNGNTRILCEISSKVNNKKKQSLKLTIKTTEKLLKTSFGCLYTNFKQILYIALVFPLLLTLNK